MTNQKSILLEGEGTETPLPTQIIFKVRNTRWAVPLMFFTAPEVHELIQRAELLKPIENAWTLTINDKDRSLENTGIMPLVHAISEISKPYMNIQRYKGLGEMNPDQLWETSMNQFHANYA